MKDNKIVSEASECYSDQVSEASEDGKHKLLDAGLSQGVEKQKGIPQFKDGEQGRGCSNTFNIADVMPNTYGDSNCLWEKMMRLVLWERGHGI